MQVMQVVQVMRVLFILRLVGPARPAELARHNPQTKVQTLFTSLISLTSKPDYPSLLDCLPAFQALFFYSSVLELNF